MPHTRIVWPLRGAGKGICGAAPPTQASGNANITIKPSGGALSAWTRTAVFPPAANGILVPASSAPLIFGADFGPSTLVLTIEAVTSDITAGRIRVVLFVAEV
jgi:D-alanyl-D-alanine carboxypeptidase